MRVVRFSDVTLEEVWSEQKAELHSRSQIVTHWMAGARSSAAVYFEVDPGRTFGRHRHSAEETIVVMEGEVEITIGDETAVIRDGGLAVAPAGVRHDLRCIGETTARCVGFWSGSSVVTLYDEVLEPRGSRRAGTPIPDGI